MSDPITNKAVKVAVPDPMSGTMQIYLVKDGVDLGPVQISTKEASEIAAVILGNATQAYDQSGKPQPYTKKEDLIDLTVTSPSGLGIGPGRKPEKSMLIFHFGDASLGFEFPNSVLLTFGQRLITAAAGKEKAQ